jgi:hypothetical protein
MDSILDIPHIGLTFSRALMPQISVDGFLAYLKKQGIPYQKRFVQTGDLKATQMEFEDEKVLAMMYSNSKRRTPIISSADNHVLDGHHRWLADHNSGNSICAAWVVDLPILELMRVAKEFNNLNEEVTHKEFAPMADGFVSFAAERLGLKTKPKVSYKSADDGSKSFGGYNPASQEIVLKTKNRHPMDIFRTLAHELVHHKQNEDGRIKDVAKEGATGSPIEDEANSMAGRLMRWYAEANPKSFELGSLVEAVFVVGVPCSGKDRVIRAIKEQYGIKEVDAQALKKSKLIEEKNTVIVSCSAENVGAIVEAKFYLDKQGYTTKCIFVDVSNDISKQRNEERKARGQRVINEDVRQTKYNLATENKLVLRKLFGENMSFIDNSTQKAILHEQAPKKELDQQFEKLLESNTPRDREWGTNSLRKLYKDGTPGQSNKNTSKNKKKIKKKLSQEANLDKALPVSSGIGPEYNVSKVPGIVSGFSESVSKWMNKPETQKKFRSKYGDLAEQKLNEAAQRLDMLSGKAVKSGAKPLSKLREAFNVKK